MLRLVTRLITVGCSAGPANGDDGIHVDSGSATITKNIAVTDADYGIYAMPGVTDGGGNQASGNGNTAECTVWCVARSPELTDRGPKSPNWPTGYGQRPDSTTADHHGMSQNNPHAVDDHRSLETSSFFGPNLHPVVTRLVGGRRGMVDGALPPALFVAVSAVGGTFLSRPVAIGSAVGVAAGTALTLAIWRLLQDQTLKQVLRGLVALSVAVVFVLLSGEPRAFFLPGLYVDGVYALLFAGSVLVGHPLAGVAYAALFRTGPGWRHDPRLRRVFVVATLGWAAVYALRAGTQWALYQEDAPVLMALAKVSLGWPLTVVAVALTLAAVRRAARATANPTLAT